jgi:secreted trypsin-like serine protease
MLFSLSSGKPNTPGIYTRVGAYNSFIRSTIGLSKHAPYYSSSSQVYLFHQFSFSIILLIVFFLI